MDMNSEIGGNGLTSTIVMKAKKQQNEHADLREIYTEKYGVTMELPGYYQETAKIVPHSPDHVVATAFHITPKSYTSTIQTTYLD
jgi:hypothetical protein